MSAKVCQTSSRTEVIDIGLKQSIQPKKERSFWQLNCRNELVGVSWKHGAPPFLKTNFNLIMTGMSKSIRFKDEPRRTSMVIITNNRGEVVFVGRPEDARKYLIKR